MTIWLHDERASLHDINAMRRQLRARHVLEIGSALQLEPSSYPAQVESVIAIDVCRAPTPTNRAPIRQLPVSALSTLPDHSIDAAFSRFALCMLPDPERALRELRRLLAPGAQFCFLEHGRSHERQVSRWQDRLAPLHARFAHGCRIDRRIDDLLHAADFCVSALDQRYASGPRYASFIYEGRACACAGCT